MTDKSDREIFVVQDLKGYRDFLDGNWCASVDKLVSPAPKLSAILLDLIMEWRAAVYAMSLPSIMPEQLKNYHDSYVNTGEINTTFLRLAQDIPALLAQRIPEMTSDASLISKLQHEIIRLAAKLEELNDKIKVEFDMDKARAEFLAHAGYQLGLWGSQRIGYVSIYNSYEHFLTQLVGIAHGRDNCRTTDDDFRECFDKSLGSDLIEKCWDHGKVNRIRNARHSLSHAGGRVTRKLGKQHKFPLAGGRIQVTPDETKEQLAVLKKCVSLLCEKAVAMPQFV